MTTLQIPEKGLSLIRDIDDKIESIAAATQVMRLNLKQSVTNDLLRSLRKNEPVRVRFGKRQFLTYADKNIQLFALPETSRSELYIRKPDDEQAIYFSGALSHRLETEQAHQATAGADAALAKLQKSTQTWKDQKEQNEARLVNDRALNGKKVTTSRGGTHLSPLPNQRSTNASPALGAQHARSTPVLQPTSASLSASSALSEEDQRKMLASQRPFIYMLAMESQTVKELCMRIRCSKDICKRLLSKYAEEVKTSPGSFELRDKYFKTLDVWGFKYQSQESRQMAIDRAISAFDRMKVTRKDEAWQMLLPPADRGKGIVLSRINLEGAPRPVATKPPAPESDADSRGAIKADTGKTTPLPKSSQSKPASQSSANSKRLSSDEESQKSKPKLKADAASVAQPVKKPSRPEPSKFKSAEFVEDSDDDTDMSDAQPLIQSSKSQRDRTGKPGPMSTVLHRERSQQHSVSAKRSKDDTGRSSTSTRPRTDSSPQKPSPLGSSPPTNATDGDVSSKTSNSSFTASPPQRVETSQKSSSQTSLKSEKPSAGGMKRKAEADDGRVEVKRHQLNGSSGLDRAKAKDTTVRRDRAVSDAKTGVKAEVSQASKPMSRAISNLSDDSGSASPPDPEELEQRARAFKQKYKLYHDFHHEVTKKGPKATEEESRKLHRMHDQIKALKNAIWRDFDRGCAVE